VTPVKSFLNKKFYALKTITKICYLERNKTMPNTNRRKFRYKIDRKEKENKSSTSLRERQHNPDFL
jgi:hypothetical protein